MIAPLGELSTFQRGLTYQKSDEVAFSDNAVLRATNIDLGTGSLNLSEMRFISNAVIISPEVRVRSGSLLICTASGSRSHLGKVAYIDDDYGYAFGGFMGQLTPKRDLNGRYLFYLLQSAAYRAFIDSLSEALNINNLKFRDLANFPVPFCSPKEQERIVAILDQAFAGIAAARVNAQDSLDSTDSLLKRKLESCVAGAGERWLDRPLSDLCDIKHGFAFKSENFRSTGTHILLTPGNFHEGGGYRDRGDKQKYHEGLFPESFLLQSGDLLLAMTEQAAGLLGSPVLVPKDGLYLHNQRLGLVRKKAGVPWSNAFFFHVFNTPAFRAAAHAGASGVKVRHTSPQKLSKISVSFPNSVEEQNRIVRELEALKIQAEELKAVYQQKLTALAALKQSLLHQAFSGNL